MDEGLEDLTLANICDGGLEAQFQERVFEAFECFDDSRRLVSKAGKLVAKIPIEIEIVYDPVDRVVIIEALADRVKLPKPRAMAHSAYRREDGLKVRPEPKQETIPGTDEGKVRPIRNGASE